MKKKTSSTNNIVVISGVQKHPVRYKLWKLFSQTYMRRLSITLGVVALIFAVGSIVYVNRIAVTNTVYAVFGLDLSKLAADLAGSDSYVATDVRVNSESLGVIDTSNENSLPDDVVSGYLIDPDTSIHEMTPTGDVSDESIRAMSDAAQVDPADNFEEEVYGGYDD